MRTKEKECLEKFNKNRSGKDNHGMSNEDFVKIVNLTENAKENLITTFPDFYIENGFIEHFEITSGKKSKKGHENKRKSAEATHNNVQKINNADIGDGETKIVTVSSSYERNEEDIENLRKSFKDTWIKHIESYDEYTGDKDISVFMVESDDLLRVYEDEKDTGVYFGDIDDHLDNDDYCLIYDEDLLDFIYNYKNKIYYVIFVGKNGRQLEVIKTENIPTIKEHMKNRRFNIVCPYGYNKYYNLTTAVISK